MIRTSDGSDVDLNANAFACGTVTERFAVLECVELFSSFTTDEMFQIFGPLEEMNMIFLKYAGSVAVLILC